MEQKMKVTVVGCFGAYPPPNGATSGYLVEDNGTKVLLDCGSGIIACLQNYIRLDQLDAVVFSHYHRDHCADLECMQYAVLIDTLLGKRKRPLEMWGGKDAGDVPCLDFDQCCIGERYTEHVPFTIGKLRFTSQANKHDIPSYCIKVEDSKSGCVVYSGDTGYYEGFADFARAADCLICECSLYAKQRGQIEGHLSAPEAGEIAATANVRSLILTHLPHYGERDSLIKEAGTAYSGKISLAYSGMMLEI